MLAVLRQVNGSAQKSGQAIWPGFALHKLGIFLVHRINIATMRGFLLMPTQVPPAAKPVPGVPDLWRMDSGAPGLNTEEDATASTTLVAGQPVLAIVVTDQTLARPDRHDWMVRMATSVYTERMQQVELNWPALPACGQIKRWSNSVEAKALMLLESQALQDAMLATDPALVGTKLQHFAQARQRSQELDGMILIMYDNFEASKAIQFYAGEQMRILLGRGTLAQLDATATAQLGLALTAPIDQMTDLMLQHSLWTGVALVRLGQRLGWQFTDAYAQGDTVKALVLAKFGPASAAKLADIKKQYPWEQYLERAVALGPGTVTETTGGPP